MALGLFGSMVYWDGDALDLSTVLEVLFELLSSSLVVYVPHKHRAIIRICGRSSLTCRCLEARLFWAPIETTSLLIARGSCNLLRLYAVVTFE
jgi:hypothetical protein